MGFVLVVTLAAALTWALQTRFPAAARAVLVWAALLHLASVVVQVYVTQDVYGGGDMLGYFQTGKIIAGAIHSNPDHIWNALLMLAQQSHDLPFQTPSEGNATGSLQALTGLVIALVGDDLYAVCATFAAAALVGNALLALALVRELPPAWARSTAVGCLLVPSAVFWTSGILKESVAIAGLGALSFASMQIARRRFVISHLLLLALAGVLVAVTKPYVLMAFIAAASVFAYRSLALQARVPVARPAYLALVAVVAYFGLVLIGAAFPRFALEAVGDEVARLQAVGEDVAGGSSFASGPAERSIAGQLAYAPFALFTGLFRPMLPDVRNGLMLIAALENTAIAGVIVLSLIRLGARRVFRAIGEHPPVAFALTLAVVLGTGVGLATNNLGTLVRYRAPVIPCLGVLAAVLSEQIRALRQRASARGARPDLRSSSLRRNP